MAKRKRDTKKVDKLILFLLSKYEQKIFQPHTAYNYLRENRSVLREELGVEFDFSFEEFKTKIYDEFLKTLRTSEAVTKLSLIPYIIDSLILDDRLSYSILARSYSLLEEVARGKDLNLNQNFISALIYSAKDLRKDTFEQLKYFAEKVQPMKEIVEKQFTPENILNELTNGGRFATFHKYIWDFLSNESNKRLIISLPPQHGKTTLILTYIAYYMITNPGKNVAFISYSQTIAEEKVAILARFFERHNLQDSSNWRLNSRRITNGSKLFVSSIDGTLTGEHFDFIVLDDPYKNLIEATSRAIRNKVLSFYRNVVISRGFDDLRIVVISTRWHPDDIIGFLSKNEEGYKYLKLPALAEENDPLGRPVDTALWELKHSAVRLKRLRQLYPEVFASLYQGNPRVNVNSVFVEEPQFYSTLPTDYFVSVGVDFAFSTNLNSDYTAVVVIAIEPETNHYYLLDCRRWRSTISWTIEQLKRIYQKFQVPLNCEGGGAQKAIIDLLKQNGIAVREVIPKGSKLVRSIIFSDAWNSKRFFLPITGQNEQLAEYIEEVRSFTGEGDVHDDFVDATVYAMMARTTTFEFY